MANSASGQTGTDPESARGRPWPDDQPRHMVRTTAKATDVDGLKEMYPDAAAA